MYGPQLFPTLSHTTWYLTFKTEAPLPGDYFIDIDSVSPAARSVTALPNNQLVVVIREDIHTPCLYNIVRVSMSGLLSAETRCWSWVAVLRSGASRSLRLWLDYLQRGGDWEYAYSPDITTKFCVLFFVFFWWSMLCVLNNPGSQSLVGHWYLV